MSKRFHKLRNLPVYKKAEEIYELANALVAVIDDSADSDDHSQKEFYTREILSNSTLILGKIAGASAMNLYSLRMYNAVIIRLAVKDMMNAVICTEMFNMNEEDYVQLMRDKVEEFRLVFVEWIKDFDKTNDLPDNWAIRFDTSTSESEKLEQLMFDEDKFFDGINDDDIDWDADDETKS